MSKMVVASWVVAVLLLPTMALAQSEPDAEQTDGYACGVANPWGSVVLVKTQLDAPPDCPATEQFPNVLDADQAVLATALEPLCEVWRPGTSVRVIWFNGGSSPLATPYARRFAIQVYCTRLRDFAADNDWDYVQPQELS